MHKFTNIEVDWKEGYSSDPSLVVTVNKLPRTDHLFYEMLHNCYFATDGLIADFFCNPGTGGSISGNKIINNFVQHIEGAWSSRAGVINALFDTRVVDVTFQTSDNNFRNVPGSITVDLAYELLDRYAPGIGLYPKTKPGEIKYVPITLS